MKKESSFRILRALIGIMLIVAILAGCAPQPAATDAPADAPAASAATDAPAVTAPAAAVEEPVETEEPRLPQPAPTTCEKDWTPTYPAAEPFNPPVEVSVPFGTNYSFMLEGDEILDNPMYNRLVEQLGLKYTIAWQADGGDYWTRLTNDLAAGTLPDAFRVNNSRLATFIDAGAAEDITDLWETYASDLVKSKKGYPDSMMWMDVSRDGRIYGISYKEDGFGDDSLLYIRQDWMDQLGLAAPTTLDEITEVARAMKSAGLAEFPIAASANLNTWAWSLDPVFGAYGVIPATAGGAGAWLTNDDGTLAYSSVTEGAKQALAVIKTWYDEGLINPDFINLDETAAGDAFMASQVGIGFQPWWGSHGSVIDLYAAFPEAKISVIPNPIGPNGTSGRAGTSLRTGAMLFRKGVDPQKIEAVIKQINWQTELHTNWSEYEQYGEFLMAAGFFRGYEWDFDENCNVVLGPMPNTEWMYGRDWVGGYRGSSYPDYIADNLNTIAEWREADPATLNKAQKFIISDPTVLRDVEYFNIAYATRDEVIKTAFQGRSTDAINEVLPDLLDFERTSFLEFITGARSLDDWDAFVTEWYDRGGQVYTDEVNLWNESNQ